LPNRSEILSGNGSRMASAAPDSIDRPLWSVRRMIVLAEHPFARFGITNRDMRHNTYSQLASPYIALHWGIKAAQAGLPLSSNPYRAPQTRAAWEAGHRQMSAPEPCPA
jgi:hypothetical protein